MQTRSMTSESNECQQTFNHDKQTLNHDKQTFNHDNFNSQPFNPTFPDENNNITNNMVKCGNTINESHCCNSIKHYWSYLKLLGKFAMFVCCLSIIHWTIITLYISWCYKPGIWGSFVNIFTVGTPICQALNRIQTLISEHFVGLFISSVVGFNTAVQSLFSM